MDLIDKYLGEGKTDWKDFYKLAKDRSGKTFKEFEKKYSSRKFQMPHIKDALDKSKDFKEFQRMIKRFNEAKNDYITNAWGSMQSIKGIKSELEKAKKSKKDVFNSQTSKTMKNAEFIKKTKKLLGEARSVPDKHQKKIAIDTVKNPMKGALLGGPSAKEAEEILRKKFGYSDAQIKKLKMVGGIGYRK